MEVEPALLGERVAECVEEGRDRGTVRDLEDGLLRPLPGVRDLEEDSLRPLPGVRDLEEDLLRPLPGVREREEVRGLLFDAELRLFPLVRDLPLVELFTAMLVASLISQLVS